MSRRIPFSRPRRPFVSALAAAVTLTASLTAALAGTTAAHAATCNPAPGGSYRYYVGNSTPIKEGGRTFGQLSLGYIPDCRYEYAEVHFSTTAVLNASSLHIWVQDAAGAKYGQTDAYCGHSYDPCLSVDGSWYDSNMISIGNGSAGNYWLSEPRLNVNYIWEDTGVTPPILECTGATYIGVDHNFYDGTNVYSHQHETC